MTTRALPDSLSRLFQDHIEMRMALNLLEREVALVAQYHAPNGAMIGGAAQYFANFPARSHHPIEDMLFDVLKARAPDAAKDITSTLQHGKIIEHAGDFTMVARNLFLDPPKWRVPFCATARSFIVLKREHIHTEERMLFRVALEQLAPEDWYAVDHAAGAANARWNDDPAGARAADILGLRLVREARANGAVHRA